MVKRREKGKALHRPGPMEVKDPIWAKVFYGTIGVDLRSKLVLWVAHST